MLQNQDESNVGNFQPHIFLQDPEVCKTFGRIQIEIIFSEGEFLSFRHENILQTLK
jgi:hypothetical protein